MTLATMHAKLFMCVCVCVRREFQPSFQNNRLYACTVMSSQGSLLHVMARTQNDTVPENKFFFEGKWSLEHQFGFIQSLKNQKRPKKIQLYCPSTVVLVKQDRYGVSLSMRGFAQQTFAQYTRSCLPCFNNASLASCSKISFSTGGVTKQPQSTLLM